MRPRFRLRTLFALVTPVALLVVVVPHLIPKPTGFARGEAEAKQQIRRGHVTMYSVGMMMHPNSCYDASTGLPIEQIEGDIILDVDAEERARGHNEFVRRWMATGNVPPNSLKEYDGLIRAPLTTLDGSSFVDLPIQTPVKIGSFRIVYCRTIRSGMRTHHIIVRGPATRWKYELFAEHSEQFSAALIADSKIVVIRCFILGPIENGNDKYERVDLLDAYTGILLAVDSRLARAEG